MTTSDNGKVLYRGIDRMGVVYKEWTWIDSSLALTLEESRIAELEAALAAQREDAAVGRAMRKMQDVNGMISSHPHGWYTYWVDKGDRCPTEDGPYDSPYEALDAARLIDNEEAE